MQTSQPVKPYRSNTLWYILTISICIIIVSIGCYVFVKQQRFFLLKEKRKEIATIADIKMSQLVQWRNDRLADGASIRANVMMASRIKSNISNKSNIVTHNEFRLWMLSLIDLGEYSKGILFTPEGKVISSDSNFKRPLSDHYLQLVSEAAKSRKVILTDFHQDSDGATYDINLVIPIMNPEGSHPGCFAVIVFDINPDKRLYPLIQAWPTVSATAETLLVKREGNSVLFLNDLRFRKKTPTLYKHPLAPNTMPAVRAALGQTGDFEDIDYRKSRVLCTTRVIPDTTWGLVAKIDVNEVLSPLTKTIWMIIIAGFVAITAMTLGIFLWSSRRRSEALRKLFAIEQEHTDTLKKAEDSLTRLVEKQQQLLDIFPALIWKAGTDARCNYFNQTWLTFTGRTLEEELGDGWATGVHPEDLERCVTFYMESFQAQRPFEIEYRLRYNDGSYHWISDNGVPHHDLNNIFVGYIGCCYDINDQIVAEAELQGIHLYLEQQIIERTGDLNEINVLLRQEMAERKQLENLLLSAKRLEAIGQIAGGVAHEVRNPLNAILTITEALFREKEIGQNPEFAPYILHIRTQVNRLVHLMNDLLDLGRTIPAKNFQPISLYEVCRETLNLWKSSGLAKNRQGDLSFNNENIWVRVLADGLKLQQVFFNLLENAGHHTSENSKIIINLEHNYSVLSDNMAIVQIVDQGTGIDEDNISHVFEPFYTDRKGGTGLGLALVKHFIENMGGTVSISNNSPLPGCTVEVRIPLYREELQ